jgi:alkanesulfonate monooxygenase SsuD/methylene tetrahydromethanopterin reductase-like flavin-dependent oxidoreductase (luciferase family)
MKFDIFCEIQRAKPWEENHELALLQDTLDQAQQADRCGFDIWWQVEHHGAPQFSYSAAPEVVLTAIAMRSKRMHVGHAGVLAPFKINGPLRVAERGATIDLLSGGRFELGLAKTGGKEWETFGVDPAMARDELREALTIIPKMWTQDRFKWNSSLFQMPEREVVPKPLQRPHPRLWQTASSPESFRMAGELGVGVLGTTLLSPIEYMKAMLDEYDQGLASCKCAVGAELNQQKGVFTFVHVAESRKAAIDAGAAWSALWYVHYAPIAFAVRRAVWYDQIKAGLNPHLARKAADNSNALQGEDPTSLDILPDDLPVIVLLKKMAKGQTVSNEEAHEVLEQLDSVVIGDVDHCRRKMEKYRNIGADRLMCLMQFGRISHDRVMRSMKLCQENLMPALK